jgi:hypothetical protein
MKDAGYGLRIVAIPAVEADPAATFACITRQPDLSEPPENGPLQVTQCIFSIRTEMWKLIWAAIVGVLLRAQTSSTVHAESGIARSEPFIGGVHGIVQSHVALLCERVYCWSELVMADRVDFSKA